MPNIGWMYGAAVYKEVLYRRGVISSPGLRGPGALRLDDFDQCELDAILADVSQLFSTAPLVKQPAVVAA